MTNKNYINSREDYLKERREREYKEIKEPRNESDKLLFTALGGLEEIGINMSVFEYKDEIVIIDMGLKFPVEQTPGIDYIIPDVSSLVPKKKNIKAIIITHAHYDHIGAIPHLTKILGGDIPIYTQPLSRAIIEKRQKEFPNSPKLKIYIVKDRQTVKISKYFEAKFFETFHTIPDSISIMLKTPVGNMAYSSDLKIDYDLKGNPLGTEVFSSMGKEGVSTLFLESTGADREGRTVSEAVVEKNINNLVGNARGRVIIGMFASLISRMATIVHIAENQGRKVFLSGFSLKSNAQIAQTLGYLKAKKDTILPIEEMRKYKDENVLILSTGAQGEPNASLMKIANGQHKYVSIKKGDEVIFSSSIIPGNELSIQALKDGLVRQGAVVYQSEHIDVHSSGHGLAEDLKLVTHLVKPKFFVPIHGMYFMRSSNIKLAQEEGVPEKNCVLVPNNGQIVLIDKDNIELTKQVVSTDYVMVDGLGVGDVEHVVMRDRLALSNSGMLVVIATLDRRSGKLLKNPDIISRGFIYLKDNKQLVEEVRRKVKNTIERIPRVKSVEALYMKKLIREQLGKFIYNKVKRRPMILPVVIEV